MRPKNIRTGISYLPVEGRLFKNSWHKCEGGYVPNNQNATSTEESAP